MFLDAVCASGDHAAVPDDGRSRDTLLRSVEGRGQSPQMAVASDGALTSGRDCILAVGGDGVFLPFPFILSLFFLSILLLLLTVAVTMLVLTVTVTYS